MFPFPFSFVAPVASGIGTVDNVYSMEFDGVDDYLSIPTIDLGTSQTISFWVYRNSSNNQGIPIGDVNSGWVGIRVYMNRDVLYYRAGTTIVNFGSILGSTQAVWTHVCITRNLGSTSVYLNGVFNNTQTIADSTGNFSVDSIGGTTAYSAYVDGKMDEVAFFDYALDSDQVEEIYNATSTGVTADLDTLSTPPVAWYRMGD